jgi:hypothetical protein
VFAEGASAMANDTDVLLKFCEQQWMEAKQAEDQRAAITNIVLLVASAILGFIAQNGLTSNTLPLTVLLTTLGIYGAIASEKLYERHQFHSARAWSWRERIDQLHPDAQLLKRKEEAVAKHSKKFPLMSKIRLHYLWFTFHGAIALIGIILTVIAIF